MITPLNASAHRLAGEVAIVTGSSGQGTASDIARLFAHEGAATVVTGRSVEAGEALAEEIREDGGDATFFPCDITDDEQCKELVARTVDRYGKLTVLVNSAVRHHPDALHTITELEDDEWREAWDETMQVNPRAWAWMCRCAIPAMIEAGHGSIVNLGSRTATRGVPSTVFPTASRGAIHALTLNIAIDYAKYNIRCNVVAPGAIVGKARGGRNGALDEGAVQRLASTNLTRPPTTLDMAYAALFLACAESGAITGLSIPVDGGASFASPQAIRALPHDVGG
jgi:NAD(P)-dependent dehydrogenase (short-subunit alcohol dehydrogenase family)